MGVQDQGVGALHAGERRAELVEQREEAAVRGVDVEPEPLPLGDGGDSREGIDRAGVGGARGPEDEPGPESPRPVLRDELGERLGTQAEAAVHRDVPSHGLAQAGHADGLVEAVVRVGRRVDHRALVVAAPQPGRLARRDDRDQARDGSARGQVAVGAGRESHQLRHPVEDQILHRHRPRPHEADAGVLVGHRGDVVGERGRVEPSPGDVPQVAGVGRNEAGPHDGLVDQTDEVADRRARRPHAASADLGHGRLVVPVGGDDREFVQKTLGVAVGVRHEPVALGRVRVERSPRLRQRENPRPAVRLRTRAGSSLRSHVRNM